MTKSHEWDYPVIARLNHVKKKASTWTPKKQKKCFPGHTLGIKTLKRSWVRKDGTVKEKIYSLVYCSTCQKAKEKENKEFKLMKLKKNNPEKYWSHVD
jgi:hypothetical protein